MATVLSALGVAFAALCVWLAVRLINRGWRPGRRFWFITPLVLLVGYAVSLGPACWWQLYAHPIQGMIPTRRAPHPPTFYWPIGWLAAHAPDPVRDTIVWYATLFGADTSLYMATDWSGDPGIWFFASGDK